MARNSNQGGLREITGDWGLGNLFAAIILLLVLVVGGSALGKYASNKQANKEVAGIETQATPVAQKTIQYDGQDGKNALDLLKEKHQIQTQDSSAGSFVTSIDGTENTDDTYWMFYINGELAPTAADQYQTKSADKIEWRFETFQS